MNIYIIDEYVSSRKNGIGTFLKELINICDILKLNICIIEFNSNKKSFCIKKENSIKKICFPAFLNSLFLKYYKAIDKFLRLYIEDSQENVFMFNHSPCEKFMETIRNSFPLSKIVFTIHDMGWTSSLLGDTDRLKYIISKRKQKKIGETYSFMLDYFDEERRMYEIADRIICLSEDTHDLLTNTYKVNKEKINLIPNAIRDNKNINNEEQANSVKKEFYISQQEKIILYVGRLTETKGCFTLLNCFKKVLENYSDCRLVLAGNIDNSLCILNLCSSFASKVTFTGLIDYDELRKWYQIADIGVIPSFSEQSSYTAIEMMMHGLSIVSANGYGLRNMFKNRENALTVNIQRGKNTSTYEGNFADAILEVLKDENLMQVLKNGARKTFLEKFEQKYMQANYEKIFDTLNTQKG